MQPEQDANIACLVRKGFAIRVPKSRDPSKKVLETNYYTKCVTGMPKQVYLSLLHFENIVYNTFVQMNVFHQKN
jgi:hypothetical protein